MGSVRVYITPFDVDGNYTDEVEVTKDVKEIGKIDIDTDSSDFQLGVYRQSNVQLKFNNRSGKYSDVDTIPSIFRYTRANSKVRITWRIQEEAPLLGSAICGEFRIGPEIELCRGLINDEALTEDAKTEEVALIAMGYETLLSRVLVPFSSVNIGDELRDVLYAILNQSPITDYLTVDLANINPPVNEELDEVEELENKTAREALDDLLVCGNAVLYIEDNVIYVDSREPTASVQNTFYGQASQIGAENIIDIKKINSGKHRLFNFLTWADTVIAAQDADSVARYGIRKLELNYPYYTDANKQLVILEAILEEFRLPRQEFELSSVINYTSVELALLDRIGIDYPTVFVAFPGSDLPICGVAICGEAVLPRGLWAFFVPPDREYKILKKTFDPKKEEITLKLRQI